MFWVGSCQAKSGIKTNGCQMSHFFWASIKAHIPSLKPLGFDRGMMNKAISSYGGETLWFYYWFKSNWRIPKFDTLTSRIYARSGIRMSCSYWFHVAYRWCNLTSGTEQITIVLLPQWYCVCSHNIPLLLLSFIQTTLTSTSLLECNHRRMCTFALLLPSVVARNSPFINSASSYRT